jgi:hypothetical protein
MMASGLYLFPVYLLYTLVHHVMAWTENHGWNFNGYSGWGFVFLWMLEILAMQFIVSIVALAVLKGAKSTSFIAVRTIALRAFATSMLLVGLEAMLPLPGSLG